MKKTYVQLYQLFSGLFSQRSVWYGLKSNFLVEGNQIKLLYFYEVIF